jgi:hypothetical protein
MTPFVVRGRNHEKNHRHRGLCPRGHSELRTGNGIGSLAVEERGRVVDRQVLASLVRVAAGVALVHPVHGEQGRLRQRALPVRLRGEHHSHRSRRLELRQQAPQRQLLLIAMRTIIAALLAVGLSAYWTGGRRSFRVAAPFA